MPVGFHGTIPHVRSVKNTGLALVALKPTEAIALVTSALIVMCRYRPVESIHTNECNLPIANRVGVPTTQAS